jgi:hypothetical protein
MRERRGMGFHRAALKAACCTALLVLARTDAAATELFKCGTTFQDRPCETKPVQQRFSRTEGSFSIEQVNPETDKDCARAAQGAIGWWNRMAAGEPLERLQAEIQSQNISRYEKSRLRDALTALRTYRGNPTEVRSQFEFQCMAYKRRHGYPTEREIAEGAASIASDGPPPTPTEARGYARSQAAARRAEAAARRAAIASERMGR